MYIVTGDNNCDEVTFHEIVRSWDEVRDLVNELCKDEEMHPRRIRVWHLFR